MEQVYLLTFDWIRDENGKDNYLYSDQTVHTTMSKAVQRVITTARVVVKLPLTEVDLYQHAIYSEPDTDLAGVVSGVGAGDEHVGYCVTRLDVDDPTDPQAF